MMFVLEILNLFLQSQVSKEDLDEIVLGVCKWVVDYEWCVRPFVSKKTKADSIHAHSLLTQRAPQMRDSRISQK